MERLYILFFKVFFLVEVFLFVFPEDNQVSVRLKKYFDLCNGVNENDS